MRFDPYKPYGRTFSPEGLKSAIESAGKTPFAVCRAIDCRERDLNMILNGKRMPRLETLYKIVQFLGVPIDRIAPKIQR